MTARRITIHDIGDHVFFVSGRFAGMTGVVRAHNAEFLHIVDLDHPTEASGPYAEATVKEIVDVASKLSILGQRVRAGIARLAARARPIFYPRA